MPFCPRCGKAASADSKFCTACGSPLNIKHENCCTNPDCVRFKSHFQFAPSVQFCDQCGKFTTDGKEIDALT